MNFRVFIFFFEAKDVPMKTDLAYGQDGYFNLQPENTNDFNSISMMIWIINQLIMKTLNVQIFFRFV
jgi:hypothetical protein